MADTGPLVTVVVAVKGDRRVCRLLESLAHQTVPRATYEVVVVENGIAVLAAVVNVDPGLVQYLHVQEANMAAARNVGLRAAQGRYLLLTDADCVALPDWVGQMSRHLAAGAAG